MKTKSCCFEGNLRYDNLGGNKEKLKKKLKSL